MLQGRRMLPTIPASDQARARDWYADADLPGPLLTAQVRESSCATPQVHDRPFGERDALRGCQGQRASVSTWRATLRKVRITTITPSTPTLVNVGDMATVRMMSPATRNSRTDEDGPP
jgi:hypothetical protein